MAEQEFLIPGSTPVRAIRAVWDPTKPTSQIKIETAVRVDMNDIDRRHVTILPRELKWLYENTILRVERQRIALEEKEKQRATAHADAPPAPGFRPGDPPGMVGKPLEQLKPEVVGAGITDALNRGQDPTGQKPKAKPGPKPKAPAVPVA